MRSAAAWDDRNLYLAWEVRDPTPWLNAATAPEQMYTGGDTVDFQLGADPKAAKNRGEAVAGDLRLSIGNFQGQPTAVLYRKVSDVKKPKQFSSGVVKDYAMDYVDVLAGAKIKVTPRGKQAYVVEAAVPLERSGRAARRRTEAAGRLRRHPRRTRRRTHPAADLLEQPAHGHRRRRGLRAARWSRRTGARWSSNSRRLSDNKLSRNTKTFGGNYVTFLERLPFILFIVGVLLVLIVFPLYLLFGGLRTFALKPLRRCFRRHPSS